MGLTPHAAMAATASCICQSADIAFRSATCTLPVVCLFLTGNVPVLRIDADPVIAAASHEARVVGARQHLPRPERDAAAGAQRLQKPVCSLHCDGLCDARWGVL